MILHFLLMIFATVSLSACGMSWFVEPKANPVIEDSVEGIAATLATTAERRVVLLPLKGMNVGKFCAEPSPDAAEALASSFKAAIDASASVQGQGEGALKAEIARTLLTTVGALTKRSQGLQFYRDGVFALCQSRLNDFIDNKEFVNQLLSLRSQAVDLMKAEMAQTNWNSIPAITITTPKQSSN